MFNVLFLQLQLVLSQITTPNPVQIETQERLLINQEPCGDNPENTYFISKQGEFIQISNCPVVNSSIFINGEFDITSLTPMENISTIHGDLVIQDSHTIYNLKGLDNLRTILSDDLYMDRYALYINNNENLGFVNNVNWTKVVGNQDIFLNINNDLNYLECYNQCDGCYGPGPYLCQSCVNYTFYA